MYDLKKYISALLLIFTVFSQVSLPGSAYAAGTVGTGTAGSCDEAALETALGSGGSVTFNCGAAPHTIVVSRTKTISADTQIDGAGLITISGGNAVKIFSVQTGVTLSLTSLTVTNGNSGPLQGGAMAIADGAIVYITNSSFLNNTSNFNSVTAGFAGGAGAIYNAGTLDIKRSTFSGNTALGPGGDGGAILSKGALAISNSTFYGNSAATNSSGGTGGAVRIDGGPGPNTITNVTFSNNGNDVTWGALDIDNASATLSNSILANSTTGFDCTKRGTGTLTSTSNLIESTSVETTCSPSITSDPGLGALQNNGGLTQTMAITSASPAYNFTATCPSGIDQRGVGRPQPAGGNCDLGAFELDTVPPETTIDSQPPDPDTDNTPTFTFSGNDGNGSGIKSFMCKMDSNSYAPCTSPFTSPALSNGVHSFYVYAIDADSNSDATPATYSWTVNSIPPVVSSITRAGASPTAAASVDFTVTFSKDVTDVDTSDFTLTTTGIIGASVTNVAGSGNTYTVTVKTGKKKGTLRLDIPAQATIKDSNGNTPSNLPYTSGEVYEVDKGPTTVGVFRPSNGVLFLKNKNTTGYADIAINYGQGGDYPVAGDWDGNGTDTIGIYRQGSFYLRNSNTIGYADVFFPFSSGLAGDQPVAGDWNGDGIDTIGVYNSKTITFYLRNSNTAGPADYVFRLGIPGDIGIAGDWTNKGFDTVGVFRPSNGIIFLKNANDTGYADIAINYGQGGDKPVTGDWDGNGTDTIGILRGNMFYLRNSNTVGYADATFALGIPGDMPIAGNWDGIP